MSVSDEIKIEKIATVDSLFDFITKNCIGDERVETVAWVCEQDYEDVTVHLDYGDEDLFVSLHDNRLRVIMGESARAQYIKNMEELAKREEQQRLIRAEQRRREIAEAFKTLARHGVNVVGVNVVSNE